MSLDKGAMFNPLHPSPTLAMAATMTGATVCNLSPGGVVIPRPSWITDAEIAATSALKSSSYPKGGGEEQHTSAAASVLGARCGVTTPLQVAFTADGTKGALLLATQLAMQRSVVGGSALYLTPYWPSSPVHATLAGLEPIVVPCFPDDPDRTLAAFSKALATEVQMVMLCYPAQPDPLVTELPSILVRMCDEIRRLRRPPLIVIDFVYGFSLHSDAPLDGIHQLFAALHDLPWLMCLGTSKGWGEGNTRGGIIATPDEQIAQDILSLISHTRTGVPREIQAVIGACFSEPGLALARKIISEVEDRSGRFREVMEMHCGDSITFGDPLATHYLVPDFTPIIGKKTPSGVTLTNASAVCKALFAEHGVGIMPGDEFWAVPRSDLTLCEVTDWTPPHCGRINALLLRDDATIADVAAAMGDFVRSLV